MQPLTTCEIIANQIVEEKSNEQLYTLDYHPSKQQHNHAYQRQFDPQHEQFKACFKAEYHLSIPLPIRVLEDIHSEQRKYAVTATKHYFKHLPVDNPVGRSDSDLSDDSMIQHQNKGAIKSRGDVKFIEALRDALALTWGFHVLDPEKNPWCTCPCSKALQPWRDKNNIDLGGLKECKHIFSVHVH